MSEDNKELIDDVNKAIDEKNLILLSKLLMTSCAAQIAVEGIDELIGYGLFDKGTKNKMQNFQNFIMRDMAKVVNSTYELDEEMTQYLIKSIENYLNLNFTGMINAKPEEIIARYYNVDK